MSAVRKEGPMESKRTGGAGVAKATALFLWVVVVLALGYGVVRTAMQAAALFA